jgi:cell wall-associated NlpC family hydrolase
LSRDAWQQVKEGEAVEKLSFAKTGDVAFFNNPEGRITHVGILLNRNQIIHASGKVRIDKIDEEGIINIRADKRTHQLHSMKRFF